MSWYWLAREHVDAPKLVTDDLLRLLSWQEVPGLFDVLLDYYRERCASALTGCIELVTHAEQDRGAILANDLDALPNPAFDRLLTAPETFSLLAGLRATDADGVGDLLLDAIDAEQARRDGRYTPTGPVWTALGDFFATPKGQRFHAPRLGGHIPVDLVSPQVRRATTPRCGEALELESFEAQRIMLALGRAYDGLAAVPWAAALVDRFTSVVVIRKDSEDPDVFRSSSTNGCPGQTLLINAHLDSATPVVLADALLHEAIHSLLYRWEHVHPFVTDPAHADAMVTSPWTDNHLELPTYLHACLVWHGLGNFWAEIAPKGVLDVAQSDEKRLTAQAGFDGEHGPRLDAVAPAVSPTLATVIRSIDRERV